MMTNINKNFGSLKGHKEKYLSLLVKIYPVVNGCSRVFAGPLMDWFNFKILYTILNVIVIVISSSIYFIAEDSTLYFIYNMLAAVCLGSNFAIFPTFVSKKFGIK
jgi:MFS family permease